MIFAMLAPLFSMLLDLLSLLVRSDREKDLEILLLRQQIRILQRKHTRTPRLSWWEKLPLALLVAKLVKGKPALRPRLSQCLLLFTPEAVLRWHRGLVRRKWTFPPYCAEIASGALRTGAIDRCSVTPSSAKRQVRAGQEREKAGQKW